MRQFKLGILSILLVVVALATACSKKEAGPPPAEIPPDGVSGIPAPAERATDMSPVDLPVAGTVKEVKAKVLDKEAEDKSKGLVRVKVLALEGPIDVSDNTRLEIRKPGSDPEEQQPEMSDWASHEPAVTPGTWDIRLLYGEGDVCKAEGWVRNVSVVAGKLWKAEVLMAAPMQWVRIYGTLGGNDVADNAHVEVFKSGTDQQEFQPIISFWTTNKVPLLAGNYDLRLTYDHENVRAKGALTGFAVGSNHGVQKKTVVLTKQ